MPSKDEIAKADCGAYPEDYEALVQRYIRDHFFDPYSVRDLEIHRPVKTALRDAPISGGKLHYGYMVTFTANAKNRYGAYVGKKSHSIFVRDGVSKSMDDRIVDYY